MLNTRIVKGTDQHGRTIELTIAEADLLIGAKRARFRREAEQEGDPDRRLLRLFYADAMAATVQAVQLETEHTGERVPIPLPLPFEEYIHTPERLGAQWESAIYELNPHWLASAVEDHQKKVSGATSSSASASSAGTRRKKRTARKRRRST